MSIAVLALMIGMEDAIRDSFEYSLISFLPSGETAEFFSASNEPQQTHPTTARSEASEANLAMCMVFPFFKRNIISKNAAVCADSPTSLRRRTAEFAGFARRSGENLVAGDCSRAMIYAIMQVWRTA